MSGELKACVEQADRDAAEQWRFIEGRYSEYEGDFVADLAADFARHRRAPAWEGIETVPDALKDGTEILICGGTFTDDDDWTGTPRPFTGRAIVTYHQGYTNPAGDHQWKGQPCHSHDEYRWHEPLFWQPLPAAPADGGK